LIEEETPKENGIVTNARIEGIKYKGLKEGEDGRIKERQKFSQGTVGLETPHPVGHL
jgi:hypothetical protein